MSVAKLDIIEAIVRLQKDDQTFIIYDECELVRSCEFVRMNWRAMTTPQSRLLFSVKANPNLHLLKIINKYVDGFDVSSLSELRLIKDLVNRGAYVTWSGPAKTDKAIVEMLQYKIDCCHLDSFDELQAVQAAETSAHQQIQKTIRLPRKSATSQKLGFSERELTRLGANEWRNICGFHQYIGRDEFSENLFSDYLEQVEKLKGKLSQEPAIFWGPGFSALASFKNANRSLWQRNSLTVECGRALVQSSGTYLTKIKKIEKTDTGSRIIVSGGRCDFGGYWQSPKFGFSGLQLKIWRAGECESLILSQPSDSTKTRHDTIEGEMGDHDLIWSGVLQSDAYTIGDWISLSHCGGYGVTAANNQWAGHKLINEWLLTIEGELKCITPSKVVNYLDAGIATYGI